MRKRTGSVLLLYLVYYMYVAVGGANPVTYSPSAAVGRRQGTCLWQRTVLGVEAAMRWRTVVHLPSAVRCPSAALLL